MTSPVEKTRYFEAVGRRKTAVARARILPAAKQSFEITGANGGAKDLAGYFATAELQNIAEAAFSQSKIAQKFKVTALVSGGGIHSQAEALRHAISRALLEYDGEMRKKLKKLGFLKRDPRAKERRKFGLKKARKSPQWSKR
ncbi:MAG: 30S ribosomal protein S9 [Patescibacteria group bacterium]|nr:30S ribosomal protein S9 [Patescibacteria group bacterium]MDE2116916.1 30S ribosomal protein S9 [Patescibacteria group bacterium]